jgi:hypothetical protein
MEKFQLSENFLSKYKRKKAPFGFNGLGAFFLLFLLKEFSDN